MLERHDVRRNKEQMHSKKPRGDGEKRNNTCSTYKIETANIEASSDMTQQITSPPGPQNKSMTDDNNNHNNKTKRRYKEAHDVRSLSMPLNLKSFEKQGVKQIRMQTYQAMVQQ